MIRLKDMELPRILIMVFTALAVIVSLCLGNGEVQQAAGSAVHGTDGITGWVDNFIPSPAEEPAVVTKNGTSQFTPLRTGFQRIFIFCGIHSADPAFYQPSLGIRSKTSYVIDVKNTIFLNLRI
ncbi:MAG: hypothetical protein LBP81_04750 [Treponema sp.]|jgi:hypothetical protein|nr:hypothetical protein [Treponema sp.]